MLSPGQGALGFNDSGIGTTRPCRADTIWGKASCGKNRLAIWRHPARPEISRGAPNVPLAPAAGQFPSCNSVPVRATAVRDQITEARAAASRPAISTLRDFVDPDGPTQISDASHVTHNTEVSAENCSIQHLASRSRYVPCP